MKIFPFLGTVSILAVLAATAPALRAQAIRCAPPPELGQWEIISPGNTNITRLTITLEGPFCQWPWQEDRYYGPRRYVEPVGRCALFFECSWGSMGAGIAYRPPYGTERPGDREGRPASIFAAFDRGFARIYLYIDMSVEEKGLLSVLVYTDFPDGGPPDTVEQLKFRWLTGP